MPVQSITSGKTIVSNMKYVFKFGKYKGSYLENIVVDDPGYVIWLDNHDIVQFSSEILRLAELNENQGGDYPEDYPDWMAGENPF